MNKHLIFVVWIISAILPSSGFAQSPVGLVERVSEVSIEQTTSKNFPANVTVAKRILSEMTVDRVSSELIMEMIGETKYLKNKGLIQNKIIKNSSRYVPFVKFGEVVTQAGPNNNVMAYKMTSQVKVSLEDLKTLLLEQGLLYEFDGTPAILPLISWNDQINSKSYSWWYPQEKNQLWSFEQRLEEKLKKELQENGFFSYKPASQGIFELIPAELASSRVDLDRWTPTFKWLSAQVVVLGEVEMLKKDSGFEVIARLSAIQISNGRQIADVVRRFENLSSRNDLALQKKVIEALDAVTEDISNQILEAWQKGSIGASVYQLVIEGRVPIQTQEAIKEVLKFKAKEIKNIRERLIESDEIVYEIDSSVSPVALAQKLKNFEVNGNLFEVDDSSETRVSYKMKTATTKNK